MEVRFIEFKYVIYIDLWIVSFNIRKGFVRPFSTSRRFIRKGHKHLLKRSETSALAVLTTQLDDTLRPSEKEDDRRKRVVKPSQEVIIGSYCFRCAGSLGLWASKDARALRLMGVKLLCVSVISSARHEMSMRCDKKTKSPVPRCVSLTPTSNVFCQSQKCGAQKYGIFSVKKHTNYISGVHIICLEKCSLILGFKGSAGLYSLLLDHRALSNSSFVKDVKIFVVYRGIMYVDMQHGIGFSSSGVVLN